MRNATSDFHNPPSEPEVLCPHLDRSPSAAMSLCSRSHRAMGTEFTAYSSPPILIPRMSYRLRQLSRRLRRNRSHRASIEPISHLQRNLTHQSPCLRGAYGHRSAGLPVACRRSECKQEDRQCFRCYSGPLDAHLGISHAAAEDSRRTNVGGR
jgi:hypothetical protein